MRTDLLIRQALHALDQAHHEAAGEYGEDDERTRLVKELAVQTWEWFRHYKTLKD